MTDTFEAKLAKFHHDSQRLLELAMRITANPRLLTSPHGVVTAEFKEYMRQLSDSFIAENCPKPQPRPVALAPAIRRYQLKEL